MSYKGLNKEDKYASLSANTINAYINLNKQNNDAFICNNIIEVGINNPISLLFITSLTDTSLFSDVCEFGVGTKLSYYKEIEYNSTNNTYIVTDSSFCEHIYEYNNDGSPRNRKGN